MHEREIIADHMAEIVSAQDAVKQKEQVRLKAIEARSERVRQVEILAGRFSVWAENNKIPFDCYSTPKSGGFLSASLHKKRGLWVVASYDTGTEKIHSHDLHVDSHGQLYGQLAKPISEGGYMNGDSHLQQFNTDMVYKKIAGICLEHEVEWTPDQ